MKAALALTCVVSAAATIAVASCAAKPEKAHGFGPVYTTVAGLAARLAKGTDDLSTVRGTLHVHAGPLEQTSTFSERLANGNVTAMDDTVSTTYQSNNTELHLITVGTKLYVDRSGNSAKPWVVATPDSSDPVVAQLAQNINDTLGQAGMHQYVTMVSSARELNLVGPDTIDGVPCAHYALSIDTRTAASKLPGSQGKQMQQAIDAGVDSIPMEIWVDAKGRSIKLSDKVTAEGATASIELAMSHFDEQVSISAPSPETMSDS